MKKILFVVCLLILGVMIYEADPYLLWHNILQWNWVLVACVAVWGIGYLFNAISFGYVVRSCAPGSTIPFSRMLRLTIGGYALNYITPFGLLGGEPWRIYELRNDVQPQAANSAVTYYAMMHVLSHIVFWLIGVVLALFFADMNSALWADGQTETLVLILVLVILGFVVVFAYRFAIKKGWIASLQGLLQAHPRQFCIALLLELASRVINVAEYWVLMQAVFAGSILDSYLSAYLVVAFSSLFANILFFSPLQMGTREGGIFLALQALEPAMPELLPMAVSISFATRIREFVWILVGIIIVKKRTII